MGGPCIIIQKEIICIKLQVQNKISDLTVKKIDYLRIKSNINILGKISGCRYEQFSADSPDQALARLPARIGNSGESDLKSMVLRGGRGWHVLTNLKNLKLKKIKKKNTAGFGIFLYSSFWQCIARIKQDQPYRTMYGQLSWEYSRNSDRDLTNQNKGTKRLRAFQSLKKSSQRNNKGKKEKQQARK